MATIAELLQAANIKIAHLEQIKTAMKAAINGSGSTVVDKFADYPPAVTNGRAGIAAAITEKGVQTSSDAPFDVLEANVRAIETGGGGTKKFVISRDNTGNSFPFQIDIAALDENGEVKMFESPSGKDEITIYGGVVFWGITGGQEIYFTISGDYKLTNLTPLSNFSSGILIEVRSDLSIKFTGD